MYWLIGVAGLFFFRGKIASLLGPWLPEIPPAKINFYGHLFTLVTSALYIIPFELLGLRMIKSTAYLASMWVTVLTLMFNLKANYGAPPIPQGLSWSNWKEVAATTLQPWLQKVMSGVDFHFLFFAVIFLTAYPSIWALSILARRSLWSVGTYATKEMPENRLWKMVAPTWNKLKARETDVQSFFALAEVLLAFWLTLSLFLPSRQILTCFLYWNYLRTRYQMPRSQPLHAAAWKQLGGHAEPVLSRVPILRKPIDMAQAWFQPQFQTR